MKKRNLILITNGYPFNGGETFLKPELDFLAKEFDRVFILSINNKHHAQRQIPLNVEVYKVRASLGKVQKIKTILKALSKPIENFVLIRKELIAIKSFKKYKGLIKDITIVLHDLFISTRTIDLVIGLMKKRGLSFQDTILYSYWFNSSATALARIKKKYPESIAVCRGHGSDIYFEMSLNGYYPFRKFTLNNLDRIFSVSKMGKEYLSMLFSEYKDKISVSYLGTFQKKNHEVGVIAKREELLIVSVSNVIKLKRVLQIPLLLAKLDGLKIKWVHFGDGILFNELKGLTEKELGCHSNISYQLKGSVPNEVIIDFYSSNEVDLFLSLSSSEGIPVSMMEAMSFGIPVISTNVGGVKELVNSDCGFLIDSDIDFVEIDNVINRYYKMSEKQKFEIREKAYFHWKKHFNAEENFPIFAQQLKELL